MEKILEYQKIDAEIIKLDKEIENSGEIEIINKMSAFYKEMQSKLLAIEKEAANISKEYMETLSVYEKNVEESKKLSGKKIDNLSGDKLEENLEIANKISGDLFSLERKLNLILTSITNILKEFEVSKNKVILAKNKYNEAKAKLDKLKQSIKPQKATYIKELKKLEKDLDANLFAKYKALKNDNVFPVFVNLIDKRCGYCRFELPSGKLDKLKNEEFMICEQCRRIIHKA